MRETFSITNETKGTLPTVPFVLYKNKILGVKYDLSLVFVEEKKIQKLNKQYRNIDKPTDILSFSLSKNSGEIFICQKVSKVQAKEFERSYKNFIPFLLIHGMVHLLGYDHGNKMEKEEEKWRKYFGI